MGQQVWHGLQATSWLGQPIHFIGHFPLPPPACLYTRMCVCIFLEFCWVIKIATQITSFSFWACWLKQLHWLRPRTMHTHEVLDSDGNYEHESSIWKERRTSRDSRRFLLRWLYYLPANVLPINWRAANHVLAFSWLAGCDLKATNWHFKSGSSADKSSQLAKREDIAKKEEQK